MNKGFTLTELIIVLAVIAILVAFAAPQFATTKERALDKEARAAISLIQAAEKIYRMEEGAFYPIPAGIKNSSNSVDRGEINQILKLNLPASATNWVYVIDSSSQQAKGTRNKPGGRVFTLPFNSDVINCAPNSDTCLP